MCIKRPNTGFTLVEMMIVVVIFTVLFGAIFTVLANSDKVWRTGRDKLAEQRVARKALDEMVKLLRRSVSVPVIYAPVVSDASRRIDFYTPVFNANGQVVSLVKVTFKLDPNDARQLLKKEGTANSIIIATDVQNISFNLNGNVISMQLVINRLTNFALNSGVALRNVGQVPDGIVIDEPNQGEF